MERPLSPSTSDEQGVDVRGGIDGIKFVDAAASCVVATLLPMNSKDGLVAFPPVPSFVFLLCLRNITIAAPIARTAAPPTAPPMMIPVLLGGLLVESLFSEASVALVPTGGTGVARPPSSTIAVEVTCMVITTVVDEDVVTKDPPLDAEVVEVS